MQICKHHPLRSLQLSGNAIGCIATNELLSVIHQNDRRLFRLIISNQHCLNDESLALIAGIEAQLPVEESGTAPLRLSSKIAFLSVLYKSSSLPIRSHAYTHTSTEQSEGLLQKIPQVVTMTMTMRLPAEAVVLIFSFLRTPLQRHVVVL